MNGLPSDDYSTLGQVDAIGSGEQLSTLLRNAASGNKVIFGIKRGIFELSRSDIENFFRLVFQRFAEQNNCRALFCEVIVYYDNGTSRTFPSIDEFRVRTH